MGAGHLKVFGCKAYPLLKGADRSPKREKMRPRAFVGYLLGMIQPTSSGCGILRRQSAVIETGNSYYCKDLIPYQCSSIKDSEGKGL